MRFFTFVLSIVAIPLGLLCCFSAMGLVIAVAQAFTEKDFGHFVISGTLVLMFGTTGVVVTQIGFRWFRFWKDGSSRVPTEPGKNENRPPGRDALSETLRPESQLTIADVDMMSGLEFEQFVAALTRCMGHTAEVTQASNDFGVDVIVTVDDERIAIQAKRYSGNVSRTAVSDAVAGKSHYGCQKAAVVTSSSFTKSAIEFANSIGCMLIDRTKMSEHGAHPSLVSMRKTMPMPSPGQSFTQQEYTPAVDDLGDEIPAVPDDVREQILANIAQDHPSDFETQEYVFGEQCRSYVRLYSAPDEFPAIPNDVKRQILADVARDHPGDYSTQEDAFQNQCKSYINLRKLS